MKIETNHGGWGDLQDVDPRPAKVLVNSLFELLDGETPTRIEYRWQNLFRAHRNMRGGALMVHSIAAINIALWDLINKDGYASLPEGTGLRCQVDEARLAELAKQPIVPEWPTRGRMKDGSIADY